MSFDISAIANLERVSEYSEMPTDMQNRLLRGIAQIVREDIERRFAASPKTPAGGYVYPVTVFWKALSESYLRNNPDRRTGQVYIKTGKTRDSLIMENANGNLTNIDPQNGTVEVGSTLDHVDQLHKSREIYVDHLELRNLITEYIKKFMSEEFTKQ